MDVSCHIFVLFCVIDTERPCPHDRSSDELGWGVGGKRAGEVGRTPGIQAGRSCSSRFHIYEISPSEPIDTLENSVHLKSCISCVITFHYL